MHHHTELAFNRLGNVLPMELVSSTCKIAFSGSACGDLATGKTSETIFISRQAQLFRLRPKAACVARA